MALGCMALYVGSCAESEDTTPSYADQNLFAPAADDHSETANIRNEFFKETGVYLLFNDTLQYVQNGTDAYGKPIYNTETVDMNYPFISDAPSSNIITYKYLKGETEKKKAADAIAKNLMSRLGTNVPYSVLAVDSICLWQMNDLGQLEPLTPNAFFNKEPYPKYLNGVRCMVISLHHGNGWTNPAYFSEIFKEMVNKKVSDLSDSQLQDFYNPVSAYTSPHRKSELGYPNVVNDSLARSLGFWNDFNSFIFARKDTDLKNFTDAVCDYSLDEVKQMMAGYPIVIQRFEKMRQIVIGMGIKLK